ncbi:MAG TPA: HPF/RaiA family ribosome-associated protein [Gemmatimonadaceae bacterium]|nr:HPF/RaiA family ribosome-associated protein [Gemmatimonadaceae bacterium]
MAGATARSTRRAPQDEKRAPFADRVPRPRKRTAGRTRASMVPANIRMSGVELDESARARIRKRLGAKLGKFATSIERVSVRVEDANGPRGGVDKLCRIKAVLSGLPSVVVQNQAGTLVAAINRALMGVERAVRRALQRKRQTPRKAASRRAALRAPRA